MDGTDHSRLHVGDLENEVMTMENFHPVPKPKTKRKKKMYNGYKNKPERTCYYCGTYSAERHEVYGGPNRQKSIEMGFQVDLCPNCHAAWHEQKEELWIRRKKEWQAHFQKAFENKLVSAGVPPKRAHEVWMDPKMIGKNYIDEVT